MGEQGRARRHSFGPDGLCIHCARARASGEPCLPEETASGGEVAKPGEASAPEKPPEIRLLTRPLAIVPVGEPGEAELAVLLTSADDSTRVAAAVRSPASAFDPDAAFRKLDDERSRAETVYQWVVDSLAGEQISPDREKKRDLVPWIPMMIGGGVVTLFALVLPGATVLSVAKWVYLAVMVLLVLGGLLGGGLSGCAVGAGMALVLLVIAAVVGNYGVEQGFGRFIMSALGTLISFMIFGPNKAAPAGGVPTGPTEYVLHPGEAARHVVHLGLVGEQNVLAGVIRCEAEDGLLLRELVLPVAEATRADAEALARMALAPDEEFARQQEANQAAAATAAEALARISDLERSRRSLPE
jgi:hypothetical protein